MQFGPLPSYATARADTVIVLTPSTRRKYVGSGLLTIASTYSVFDVFGPMLGGLLIATVTLPVPLVYPLVAASALAAVHLVAVIQLLRASHRRAVRRRLHHVPLMLA